MIACSIPSEPRFNALRREAGHYLKNQSCPDSLRHITVQAGQGDSESYSLELDGAELTIRSDGLRGASHGFHHALRLMGFGFSFFADVVPRRPELHWPAAGRAMKVRPAFAVRGFLPWGNLLNSINVWNLPDYERFLLTIWRWGCNYVWFHNYDHEPLAAFRDARGQWSHGKPYQNSFNPPCGGVAGIRVDKFPNGTARFFKDSRNGVWGAAPGGIEAAQTRFRSVIGFAKDLGINTAFGFEIAGDPSSPDCRRQLVRRIRHVLEAYPDLHTLCLWESEGMGLYGWQTFDASPGYPRLSRQFGRHFRYLSFAPNRQAEGVRLAALFNWA